MAGGFYGIFELLGIWLHSGPETPAPTPIVSRGGRLPPQIELKPPKKFKIEDIINPPVKGKGLYLTTASSIINGIVKVSGNVKIENKLFNLSEGSLIIKGTLQVPVRNKSETRGQIQINKLMELEDNIILGIYDDIVD